MVDVGFLSSWIQPQHLEEPVLHDFRERFQANPARMGVIEDLLVEDKAAKLARFLATEANFTAEYGLYSVEGATDQEQWSAAEERDRFFRFGKLVGIAPEAQFSPNALTYLQFRKAFQDERFKAFFEAASGLDLGVSDDFGSHRMDQGDFLKAHDDDNKNRRLAIVLYLSPDWGPADGGALNVIDRIGDDHRVEARYNSEEMFDALAGSTHYVNEIRPTEDGRTRFTIGGWYHKPG